MNDEQIADVLVKAGVLKKNGRIYTLDSGPQFSNAGKAINDWRVAGACLERMSIDDLLWIISYKEGDDDVVAVGWLQSPRSICEAFAKAHTETSST